jgi:hypothetical protein
MSANTAEFIRELNEWARNELRKDVQRFGTQVVVTALQAASPPTAVDTGAMKAHLRAWTGEPDYAFDPGVVDRAPGTPLSGAQLLQAIAMLNGRSEGEPFGAVSAAPYSSFVEYGTVNMAAQPFWEQAVQSANALLLKQSDPRLRPGGDA